MRILLPVIVFSQLSLLGCDLAKTLKETRESTREVRANSNQLANRSENLNRNSRDLFTKELRDRELPLIFEIPAHEFLTKTTRARQLMAAFPFNRWSGDYTDTHEVLEDLYETSVGVFLGELIDKAPGLRADVSNLNLALDAVFASAGVGERYNQLVSLGALAVSLTTVDPIYTKTMARHGLPAKSMYDLLVEALSYRHATNPHTVPKFARMVLQYDRCQQMAELLLQLRHNFILAVVTGDVTSFGEGLWGRIQHVYLSRTQVALLEKTPISLDKLRENLEFREQTLTDLHRLNIEPLFTPTFLKAFRNITWETPPLTTPPQNVDQFAFTQAMATNTQLPAYLTRAIQAIDRTLSQILK